MVSLEEYLLFMFSMKGVGRRVDMKHILEKVERDLKIKDENLVEETVRKLVNSGLMEERKGLFGITPKGKETFDKKFKSLEKSLESVNRAWVIVYKAKQYYPLVAETVLEFCKNRYVGFYALFTEKRFFRRDFRGKKIVLNSVKDLLYFINIHYIDVIPCVHRIGEERPDWLVVDVDAGPEVSWGDVKNVTKTCYKIMKELGLNPCIKFSGSRGFQIWSLIQDFEFPEEYEPLPLKGSKRKKNYFTLFSDFVRVIQREVDRRIPGKTTSDLGPKEKRKDKILLDPSSMKPMGLVRAPYGLHSKTGLISLPISIKELDEFEPENASVEKALERYKKKGNEFVLKSANPSKLLSLLLEK